MPIGIVGNDERMRRFWLAIVAASVLATSCSSKATQQAADPTIPIVVTPTVPELIVPEPTIPPRTTEPPATSDQVSSSNVPEATQPTTVQQAAVEAELQARAEGYFAEFRRTLLNLQQDDLSKLSAWYATPALASKGVAKLWKRRGIHETYRVNSPDTFQVHVEKVSFLSDTEAEVTTCLADNLVRVRVVDGSDQVLDDSLSANRFVDNWIQVEGTWFTSHVVGRESLPVGATCA